MNAAGALYRDALWRNATALEYVRGRGIPDWVMRSCGLGYADGRSLEAYLRKHGGLRVAEDLGLLRRPEPGEDGRPLRERFAGRVVIPEIRGGQPIWFIGRRTGEPGRVKYLTPPGDKPVLGFERAIGRRRVYLIEGVFDWLTAVSWNLPAFSTCGTDFPMDRLGWLARAEIVFGVLDADTAGREAAERLGAALGRRWCPIALPDGCDLNDLGRRPDGRALFFRLTASCETHWRCSHDIDNWIGSGSRLTETGQSDVDCARACSASGATSGGTGRRLSASARQLQVDPGVGATGPHCCRSWVRSRKLRPVSERQAT